MNFCITGDNMRLAQGIRKQGRLYLLRRALSARISFDPKQKKEHKHDT